MIELIKMNIHVLYVGLAKQTYRTIGCTIKEVLRREIQGLKV
jgi:hypothetical protein